MNRLDRKARAQILHLLCEGQSIRAVTRLTGCSKNTVAKLLVEAGHACAAYQDKALRNLPCKRVQLTSDGHRPYLTAVDEVFGDDVDYGMLVKLYGADPQAETRYSPAKCVGARREVIKGEPEPKHISTSYAERSNLTMRMHMRRFTRLTNAFSKKVENHAAAIALHTFYYNFVRIHQTLKVTPAMAAGVTDKLWEMDDLVGMLEDWELANQQPEYNFVVRKYDIGKGYSISVLWLGGEVDTIWGFETEHDALGWIREKSAAWLIQKRQ